MLRPREATTRDTAVPRAWAVSRILAAACDPPARPCAPTDRSGHGAARGRLLRRACDEQGECCAGLTRRHAHRAESGWESIGRWQGRARAHRGSSMRMSAHEGVVATVVLEVVCTCQCHRAGRASPPAAPFMVCRSGGSSFPESRSIVRCSSASCIGLWSAFSQRTDCVGCSRAERCS